MGSSNTLDQSPIAASVPDLCGRRPTTPCVHDQSWGTWIGCQFPRAEEPHELRGVPSVGLDPLSRPPWCQGRRHHGAEDPERHSPGGRARSAGVLLLDGGIHDDRREQIKHHHVPEGFDRDGARRRQLGKNSSSRAASLGKRCWVNSPSALRTAIRDTRLRRSMPTCTIVPVSCLSELCALSASLFRAGRRPTHLWHHYGLA
jgi:hypothetical protein